MNAQDPFARSFRRRPSDRRRQPSDANRFRDQPPPVINVPRQGDRQVDFVPLERGPFDRRRPRSQGQISSSDRTQMDAGGQGEMMIEGEIPIPKRMLDAARQFQSGFNEPRRGSFDGGLRRGFDNRRDGRFDRNPPPPPDTFGGSQRDPQGTGPADRRQGRFDGARDRRRDSPARDWNTGGTDPRGFDRRRDPGRDFGPEPRRDRMGRGQLETSNQGSLDMGASGNLGLDVQLEGPAAILDPTGSGQFDAPRDRQGQFDRARPDRLPSDRGNLRDTRQGRFDRTNDPRFDASNQIEPSRSGSSSQDGRFFGPDGGSFEPAVGSSSGRFDGPRQNQSRSDRGFNPGLDGAGGQQVGGPSDRGLGSPRQEGIATFPQGPVDMQGGRRPDTSAPVDLSRPGPDVGAGSRLGGRFAQGQMEATNQAQLDAAGSGEVLIEGELQIPTKVIKAAVKDVIAEQGLLGNRTIPDNSSGSLSDARQGLPSISQPIQNRQELPPSGSADAWVPGGFGNSPQDQGGVNINGQGSGRQEGSQRSQGGFDSSGNVGGQGTGRFDGQGSFDGSGNVDRQGIGRFDGPQQGQGGFDARGNIDRQGTGLFDGPQQGGFDSAGNIDRRGPGRIDGARQDQGAFRGQGTGRLDGRRQGGSGFDGTGNVDRQGTVGFDGSQRRNDSSTAGGPNDNWTGATQGSALPGRLDRPLYDPIKDPLTSLLGKRFYVIFFPTP